MFVELFPTRDRLSGYSMAYNIAYGIVGGTTPVVATWLIASTGASIAPAFYLVVLSALSVVALIWMKDRSREPLR
jgi:MHS family proline/betaine transporter-like MFS transporter